MQANISDYLDEVCEESDIIEKKLERKGRDKYYQQMQV